MKILVVEDDAKIASLISAVLRSQDCELTMAVDGAEGLEKAKSEDFALIISDIVLPGMNGMELFETIKQTKPDIPIVLMTAYPDLEFAIQAVNLGAVGFLMKPFKNSELIKLVKQIQNLYNDEKGRVLSLDHIVNEQQEMVFTTGTLLEGNNLFLEATYLAQEFFNREGLGTVGKMQNVLAIHEALRNAVEHGNLDLPSFAKDSRGSGDLGEEYDELLKIRLEDPQYASRKVFIKCIKAGSVTELRIRDEGKGFNYEETAAHEQELSPEDLHGRGFMLIKAYMDKVSYGQGGREIILVRN